MRTIISKEDAKRLRIESQGFISKHLKTSEVIDHLGYVQIDTLSVVERSHHLVLHSRNAVYHQTELDKLMKDRAIFEYWSHAASYLPMSDYRFSLYRKEQFRKGEHHWFAKDRTIMKYVLDRIISEGPLQSRDFIHNTPKVGEWYDWKPAKNALEQLFMEGRLMVSGRKGFQKIYDLTERVLPAGTDDSIPDADELCRYLIHKAINAYGVVSLGEISYLRKGLKIPIFRMLKQMADDGKIFPVFIEGIDQGYYTNENKINLLNVNWFDSEIHILSPFDNLVIQRKQLSELFNFDFQIECYVPENKRKYGYYCLPVLYKNKFVARIDPKADRTTGIFNIKNIWLEPGFEPDDAFADLFAKQLNQLANFCGCNEIKLQKTSPTSFKRSLRFN